MTLRLAWCLVATSSLMAQAPRTTVTGRVTDGASGTPIQRALITVVGSADTVWSGADGRFVATGVAQLPAGGGASRTLTLRVNHAGFYDLQLPISNAQSRSYHLEAELLPDPIPPEFRSARITTRVTPLYVIWSGADSIRMLLRTNQRMFDTTLVRIETAEQVPAPEARDRFGGSAFGGAILIHLTKR